MFENAFNNMDRVMRNDEGLASELDYAEQTSWLLFLKYLDDMEKEWEDEAGLEQREYTPILDEPYRWESWAAPKTKDGAPDLNAARTGADLIDFVNGKLFPYLQTFRDSVDDPDTLNYKIGEIFAEIAASVPATRCATRWRSSTSSTSAVSRPSTSCPTCTKRASSAWATPAATAASTTRRAR